MNALAVLYGGALAPQAFAPAFGGKSALNLALEKAASFPGVSRTALLVREDLDLGGLVPPPGDFQVIPAPAWTRRRLLETLSRLAEGFGLTYYAWADCPFLDAALTASVTARHTRYAAEYSYADGWPYGFAPELLAPGTAGILAKIDADGQEPVERDTIFTVLQKDINAFDIETEIAPVDLRGHRLTLAADSRRNLLLLTRFFNAGRTAAGDAEGLITGHPDFLRTLPAFYPIQVTEACPQSCAFCPYPQSGKHGAVMPPETFETLLEEIAAFSEDAVIDISLWGDVALHPQREALIRAVLARPALSLIVETAGIGWKTETLESLATEAKRAGRRENGMAPLAWIVSLDTMNAERYAEIRGPGFAEAVDCAKKLGGLFPGDAYVQAVRTQGAEDDIEQFYRYWKTAAEAAAAAETAVAASAAGTPKIIIQKYDDFCGALPALQASDLSPVTRQPCWHIMRDMPILIDGTVPACRERGAESILGNACTEPLETIWARGTALYQQHGERVYTGPCAGCDEYYTYNF
jgi:spiro-SPASM protein